MNRLLFDSFQFRRALGRFATGVAVVSLPGGGGDKPPIGLTVNSFSSVSLDPPLILWCLGRDSDMFERFLKADSFAISVLRGSHAEISIRLAKAGNHALAGIKTEIWETGSPIISDALAAFDCKVAHRYEGGDHLIYVGRVLRIEVTDAEEPLLYFAGRYRILDPRH
jgi:flavin reductase (DIM6/NTAB) family NADH-FMN oxidoreductase RutF